MSENLEDILSIFNSVTWKTKVDMTETEWLDKTYTIAKEIYDNNCNRIVKQHTSFDCFEKYLHENEDVLDTYISNSSHDEELSGLLQLVESRLSVTEYSVGIEMNYFEITFDEDMNGYFALPEEMYKTIDDRIQLEFQKERENWSMYI